MASCSSNSGSALVRLAFALLALCVGAAAQAQSLQVAASNSNLANESTQPYSPIIYRVNVGSQTTWPPSLSLSALPPAFPTYNGFQSLAYVPSNQPGATVDLIAANQHSSAIYRFLGPSFTQGVLVWILPANCPATPCRTGPQVPISVGVDANSTLYVLSRDYTAGYASALAELWAFPKSAVNPSGFAANPVLVDNLSHRNFSSNNIDGASAPPNESPNPYQLADLLIAPAGVHAPLSAGDVLVLFGDGVCDECTGVAVVAAYNHSNLQQVISSNGSTAATPLTVANSNDIVGWDAAGEAAVSLAVWPGDSHVMVMSKSGNIYKFTWTSGEGGYMVQADPNFATGLPSACFGESESELSESGPAYQVGRLRTGVQSGISYAFVAAYSCGDGPTHPSEILLLDGNSMHAPQTVTESDGALAGLAVTAAAPTQGSTGTGSGCISGCNITGGVAQTITGTPAAIAAVQALGSAGTITEKVCIVQQDPRKICGAVPTTPGYTTAKTLPVASVCPNSHFNPGFGSTLIPDYICGNYGPTGAGSGTGFVLIQGIANGVDSIPGLLVYNDGNPDFFFGTQSANPCPMVVPGTLVGWAPWSLSPVEGTIPEGPNMIELTYGCGTSKSTSSGMSLALVGGRLSLNTAREFGPTYVSFAEFKFDNLTLDVLNAPIDPKQKARLLQILTRSELFLNGGLYNCAARKLWRADKYVADHASHFGGVPGSDPNSYGRSRSRIANLYFTIFSRIEGNNAPAAWPLPQPPAKCANNLDVDDDGY